MKKQKDSLEEDVICEYHKKNMKDIATLFETNIDPQQAEILERIFKRTEFAYQNGVSMEERLKVYLAAFESAGFKRDKRQKLGLFRCEDCEKKHKI
jgi:hypothetical protein